MRAHGPWGGVLAIVAATCIGVAGSSGDVRAQAGTSAPAGQVPEAGTPPPLQPLPRWDVTGLIGWRGERFAADDAPFSTWDHRAVYVGVGGYYWTTHVKTEVELGGMGSSEYVTYRVVTIPGHSFPSYVRTRHEAVGVPFSGRLLYQFGENAWFHPFAGAGLAFDWTRDRRHTPQQTASVRRPDGQYDQVVVAQEHSDTETLRETRPVLIAGFKAYASARAFIRADLLWSVDARDRRYRSWRIGFGTDF